MQDSQDSKINWF